MGNMHYCHYSYLLYLQIAHLDTFVLAVTAEANSLHENCYLNVNYYVSGIFNLVADDYSDIGTYIHKPECHLHVTEQQPNSPETLETGNYNCNINNISAFTNHYHDAGSLLQELQSGLRTCYPFII